MKRKYIISVVLVLVMSCFLNTPIANSFYAYVEYPDDDISDTGYGTGDFSSYVKAYGHYSSATACVDFISSIGVTSMEWSYEQDSDSGFGPSIHPCQAFAHAAGGTGAWAESSVSIEMK